MKIKLNAVIKLISFLFLIITAHTIQAQGESIATVASKVTEQADAISKLLSITSYVAGVGFALAGILQFKTHKENPQQTPLSKPVVMIIVAACLLFLPTIIDVAGNSLFGTSARSAASAGGGSHLSGR